MDRTTQTLSATCTVCSLRPPCLSAAPAAAFRILRATPRGLQEARPEWQRALKRVEERIDRAQRRRLTLPWRQNNILKSTRALEAMKQIDRADFVLDRQSAYIDAPQPIGFNATISAPHMHGYCLTLLDEYLKPGMKVLDVGSGSGYLTAVMALMVGETGHAIGVEHIPELVERSIQSIKKGKAAHLLDSGSLSIHVADGRLGYPEGGPYDAIHVGAAAPDFPRELAKQLKPGGRMVCPVGNLMQDLEVIDKKPDGSVVRHSAMGVRYVPLTAREKQLAPF